ncbi:MAG: hypothetical protein J6B31_04755 [Bacteroidaceae bacterium]|nr:hypothetical protein [Bacteroidaceae bacterium]
MEKGKMNLQEFYQWFTTECSQGSTPVFIALLLITGWGIPLFCFLYAGTFMNTDSKEYLMTALPFLLNMIVLVGFTVWIALKRLNPAGRKSLAYLILLPASLLYIVLILINHLGLSEQMEVYAKLGSGILCMIVLVFKFKNFFLFHTSSSDL